MPALTACLWCKADIPEGAEVWIERQASKAEDESEWSASFCGDEHASLWVASPFEPPPFEYSSDWSDTAAAIGCFVVAALLLAVFLVGVVGSASWIIDRIF